MQATTAASLGLIQREARALMTRLDRVQPFVLYETMVPAAAVSFEAQAALERYVADGRAELKAMVQRFIGWLASPAAATVAPAEAQRRFTIIRLRFNTLLSEFDLFADALTQRSERDNGVWLAGLDVAAADSLAIGGQYYRSPPVVCYLDRGRGAAIRRARTRLPSGGSNPVALVRIPRERMVGSGIASSLAHEVGHQGAALLGLVPSVRPVMQGLQRGGGVDAVGWWFWERWVSEVLADLWAVARVGVAGPMGLLGVVSLPRAFVFRLNPGDPHPTPWLRVKLSCAMGNALYPDPQWARIAAAWDALYPLPDDGSNRVQMLRLLERMVPAVAALLVDHRPRSLRGASLREVIASDALRASRLRRLFGAWRRSPALVARTRPALAFATIAQAKLDDRLGPEAEAALTSRLLTEWTLRNTLAATAACAVPTR